VCEGDAESVKNASGMAMTSGGHSGHDMGAIACGALGGPGVTHHGVGMSSTRSGLVRSVLASSELGFFTARVKRVRSSGVKAAHISSADDAFPIGVVGYSRHPENNKAHQDRCPRVAAANHDRPLQRRRHHCFQALQRDHHQGYPLRSASEDELEPEPKPRRPLISSLLHREPIVPVDPTAKPTPHQFSLRCERASEETIFMQDICDAKGRHWSLRVPSSRLPEDMVHMLEELEKLAVELGQALLRIVVTCSTESLSMKRMERCRDAAVAAVNSSPSSELLRPPPAIGDESSVAYDVEMALSLAKEKRCSEAGARSTELAPEFL
jgi:hypothetical protein